VTMSRQGYRVGQTLRTKLCSQYNFMDVLLAEVISSFYVDDLQSLGLGFHLYRTFYSSVFVQVVFMSKYWFKADPPNVLIG
jgi:hypothetical protein